MKNIVNKKKFKKIIEIYNKNKNNKNEYAKVLWSSQLSMDNRMKFFLKEIKNLKFKSWIDIGCGTGRLFELLKQSKYKNIKIYGLDLNPNLIKFCKKKKFKFKIKFLCKNIINYNAKKFELVSSIGILQNCGLSLTQYYKSICNLTKKKSYVFINFKTKKWIKFKDISQSELSNIKLYEPEIVKKIFSKKFKFIKSGGFDYKKLKKINSFKTGEYFIIAQKIK